MVLWLDSDRKRRSEDRGNTFGGGHGEATITWDGYEPNSMAYGDSIGWWSRGTVAGGGNWSDGTGFCFSSDLLTESHSLSLFFVFRELRFDEI